MMNDEKEVGGTAPENVPPLLNDVEEKGEGSGNEYVRSVVATPGSPPVTNAEDRKFIKVDSEGEGESSPGIEEEDDDEECESTTAEEDDNNNGDYYEEYEDDQDDDDDN